MTFVDPARPATSPIRMWFQVLGFAAVLGVIVAVAVVYAYYNDPWRLMAHTLGIWAAIAAALAWRRPLPLALGAAITFLAVAVIAYYVGLKVGHDIRWAGTSSVMPIPWHGIQLWVLLALPAGALLGWIGATAVRRDRWGPLATAALLGLLLGDAARRWVGWGADIAVGVDMLAAVGVFLAAARANRRPIATLAWTLLASLAGAALVAGPDLIEQFLVQM